MIIENISKKSLSVSLDALIIQPLKLDKTYLEQREDHNGARGNADIYGGGNLLDVTRWEHAEVDRSTAGGIISTPTDLFKFTQSLMTGKIGSTVGTESNVVYFPDSDNMLVIFKNNGMGSDKTFLDDIMK